MKKLLTTFALCFIAVASSAVADLPKSVDELVAKLPESHTISVRRTAVIVEARKNDAFYNSLKASGFVFEDVKLTRGQVVSLAFPRGDYDAFSSKEAAQFLPLASYKSFIAAKVQGIGTDAVAVFDWLQQQRLLVVESAPRDAAEKGEFLSVIADQVIAQDKAKSTVTQ